MKTHRKHRSSYLIVVLILLGCTYEPDEVFSQEIAEPEHRITFSLTEHDEKDTIYLFGPASFTFNLGINPGKIEVVNVDLDEYRILTSPRASNSFSIDNHLLKTGTYELKIQFTSNSGSGSLLDAVGGEKVQVWRKWILKIDVAPPPRPLLTLSNEDGFLKLNWTPYTKPNFVKYTLFIARSFEPSKTITITDPSQTSWIDSAYVGGREVYYTLQTYAVGTASNSIGRNDKLGLTVDYGTADSTVTIRWNKTLFPRALENYEIYENNVLRQVITSADTTVTWKLNVVWNKDSEIRVKYKPKYGSYSPEYSRIIPSLAILPRLHVGFEDLYYSSTLNAIIAHRNSHVVLFNLALQPTDSVLASSPFFAPYSGPYVYFRRGGGVARYNLLTDEEVSVATFSIPENIQGTENGVVSYTYSLSYEWRSRVYDYDSDSFIEQSAAPGHTSEWINPFISTKGTFLFFPTSHQVHEVNGSTVSFLGTVHDGYAFQGFRPDNDHEMIVDGSIYDSQTLQWKRHLTPSGGDYHFLDYDPATGYAIFGDTGTVGIHAVHVETLAVKVIPAFCNGQYRLVAGYLFDKDYNYIKVF